MNPILFEPLPYPHAERIMMIWEMRDSGSPSTSLRHLSRIGGAEPFLRSDGRDETMAANDDGAATQPERFEGQRVSAGYFRVLGVRRRWDATSSQPTISPWPQCGDPQRRVWRRRFAGDPAIVGRQITLDDNLYTVIGVMPRGFENVLAPSAEIWAPLQYNRAPTDSREWGHHLRMVGRLRRGGQPSARQTSELDVILHALAQIYARATTAQAACTQDSS